jgi:hypothetical protein
MTWIYPRTRNSAPSIIDNVSLLVAVKDAGTITVIRQIWDFIDTLIQVAWNVSPTDYNTWTSWTTALSDAWKAATFTRWGYDNAVLSTSNWGYGPLEYYGIPNIGTTSEKFTALKLAMADKEVSQ